MLVQGRPSDQPEMGAGQGCSLQPTAQSCKGRQESAGLGWSDLPKKKKGYDWISGCLLQQCAELLEHRPGGQGLGVAVNRDLSQPPFSLQNEGLRWAFRRTFPL